MARSKNNGQSSESTSAAPEMKRTTYKEVVNIVKGGQREYTAELRSYGEGPIVAIGNAISKELENNSDFTLDKESLSPYGAILRRDDGTEAHVAVVWADTQCPRCGAPRNAPNSWCNACEGNVELDLSAQLEALKAQFGK